MKAFPMKLPSNGCTPKFNEGMELRDYFAGLAMQSLVSNNTFTPVGKNHHRSVAKLSYRIADEMMEVRKPLSKR